MVHPGPRAVWISHRSPMRPPRCRVAGHWSGFASTSRAGSCRPRTVPSRLVTSRPGLSHWIKTVLERDDRGKSANPGRVTIRRLNRVEYNNTIRDLIGVDFRPADDFPSDDVGYGFDNIGDVLSLPPVLMERYLAAAELISERAIVRYDEPGIGGSPARIASPDPVPRAEIAGRISRCGPCHPRAVRDQSLSAAGHTRRDQPAVEPGGAGTPERRQLRARHSARGPGRPDLAPLPLPGRARLPAAGAGRSRSPGPRSRNRSATTNSRPASPIFSGARCPTRSSSTSQPEGSSTNRRLSAGQVGRMLKDPKSRALVENFAGQWLQIRNLKSVNPDRDRFPGFR